MIETLLERGSDGLTAMAKQGIAAGTRAWRVLSSETRGLQLAVYILAASALASSILALVRDRLLAHAFGAGAVLDLYYAAFRVPDFIFVATGALVSVYVLIPQLAKRDDEGKRAYIDTVVAGFMLLSVTVAAFAAFAAPIILGALFPEVGSNLSTLVLLTRIMLLQPILLGLSNICAAITQTKHRYALYSLSPLLYNIGIIAGVLGFYPLFGTAGLAYGVVLGAVLHVGVQIPSIMRDGFFSRMPRIRERGALFETVAVSVPRALALSMNQLAFIGLTALAGLLAAGSIAVFMFAYNLQAVPLAIIGASYSVAAFPTLAEALSRGERERFIMHIAATARYVLFWSLPAIALAIVLRAHVVRTVLGSGAFDWTDTRLTAAAFALFSLSLAAQGLQLLLVRGYYASGRTLVPFAVALVSAMATVAVGALMIGIFSNETALRATEVLLRVVGVPGSRVLALAFAYSLVSIIATAFLAVHFERRFRGFLAQVARSGYQSVIAAVAVGAVAYGTLYMLGPIGFTSTTLSVFFRGFVAGLFGIVAGAVAYALMDNREYRETAQSVRGRLWRGTQLSAEETIVQSAEEGSPSTPQ